MIKSIEVTFGEVLRKKGVDIELIQAIRRIYVNPVLYVKAT